MTSNYVPGLRLEFARFYGETGHFKLNFSIENSNFSQFFVSGIHIHTFPHNFAGKKISFHRHFKVKIREFIGSLLSVDGSVDRFQLYNKHVTCKIMTDDYGKQENLFLGFDEAPERRTTGYVAAIKSAVELVIPWDSLFPIVSSTVTDGANENTGEYNSLWARLEQERVQGNQRCLC